MPLTGNQKGQNYPNCIFLFCNHLHKKIFSLKLSINLKIYQFKMINHFIHKAVLELENGNKMNSNKNYKSCVPRVIFFKKTSVGLYRHTRLITTYIF